MNGHLSSYLTQLEAKGMSPRTLDNYGREIQQFFDWLAGRECTRQVAREYVHWLQGEGYVAASIARKVSELRSFYAYLAWEDVVDANPFLGICSPRLPRRLPRYLKHGEVDALLDAPDITTPQGRRDKAILELLYASGIRLSELVGLDMADLELRSRRARVCGKGGKERIVLMGVPAAEALQEYLEDGRPSGNEAVFLNRNGNRLSKRSVGLILDKYGAAIGRKVTPHLLRHTFATHMMEGGANLRVVQELLGHAQPTTTEQYAHVTINGLKKAYQTSHPKGIEL